MNSISEFFKKPKTQTITNLFKAGIICTVSKGKKGLKGWNSIDNKEQYLAKTLKQIEKHPDYNIAINLKASNLTCLDIDNIEAFEKFYNLTFSTLSVKTPRGYHFYFRNDLGLGNYTSKEQGFEIHSENHLSNFLGKGYNINENCQEIKNASNFKSFFERAIFSKAETTNINTLHTEIFNTLKDRVLHTEIFNKKENTPEKKIFEILRSYEKDKDFIRFAFEVAFNTEAKKQIRCILHPDKHPSASVFRNKKGRFLYKDFHNDRCYSLMDLLLEYYAIPKGKQGLFRVAFAFFLESLFIKDNSELQILQALKQIKNKYLYKAFFLTASLNKLSELDTQERFLSVRALSLALQLNDITRANRLLNFLCLLDIFKKNYRGKGRACSYRLNKSLDLNMLRREIEELAKIPIFKLSRAKALEIFDLDKVNAMYRRKNPEREKREILKTAFLYDLFKKNLIFTLGGV